MKTKGILVFIQGRDCTAGGVTSGHDKALLIGDGLPEIFEISDDTPTLRLEYDLDPHGAQPGRLMVAKPAWLKQVNGQQAENEIDALRADLTNSCRSRYQIVNAVAVPADHDDKRWNMYGGHDIHTSDSRFPFTGPLPVHDRYES